MQNIAKNVFLAVFDLIYLGSTISYSKYAVAILPGVHILHLQQKYHPFEHAYMLYTHNIHTVHSYSSSIIRHLITKTNQYTEDYNEKTKRRNKPQTSPNLLGLQQKKKFISLVRSSSYYYLSGKPYVNKYIFNFLLKQLLLLSEIKKLGNKFHATIAL